MVESGRKQKDTATGIKATRKNSAGTIIKVVEWEKNEGTRKQKQNDRRTEHERCG